MNRTTHLTRRSGLALRFTLSTSLLLLLAAGLVSGCGSATITASTVCRDYLAQPSNVRHDAAVRISSEIGGVQDAGNPMWGLSLDAACGSQPSMTLGQYFHRAQ